MKGIRSITSLRDRRVIFFILIFLSIYISWNLLLSPIDAGW